jgi:Zn-dependent oligopeptidase
VTNIQNPIKELVSIDVNSLDKHDRALGTLSRTGHTVDFAVSKAEMVLVSSENEQLRRQMYVASKSTVANNLDVFQVREKNREERVLSTHSFFLHFPSQRLVDCRQSLATRLGFRSYAELTLANNKLMQHPDYVRRFLRAVSQQMSTALSDQLQFIQAMHHRHVGRDEPLRAWDVLYYRSRVRDQMLSSDDGNSSKPIEDLHHYLSVANCLRGLFMVVHRVFGLRLSVVGAQEGELWHRDVRKVQAVDRDGVVVGHVFLDLFHRAAKTPQCSTWAIQFAKVNERAELVQQAKVVMVCSFDTNASGSLTMTELENLFHEMGHCLQMLLNRTVFQHQAGRMERKADE